MKHMMIFDLKPGSDDKIDLKIYMQASEMYCALIELRDEIRAKVKYGADRKVLWEDVSTMFYQCINSHDVKLDL